MIRMGLMGCGFVADYGHLPALKATPGIELSALFDPDPHRLERARQKFNVPRAFTDVEEFFNSGLDAVSVTSPAPVHLDNVLGAARHGLHVACEKPIATDEAEARQMIEAMRAADRRFYINFIYRFSDMGLTIRRIVREGKIGTPRAVRLIYNWDNHGYYEPGSNPPRLNERRRGRMLEGGPMVDCGVHTIDLVRFWLGREVVRTSAHGAWVDEYEAPDHLWLHMDMDGGAHAAIEASFSYGFRASKPRPEFVFEVIGTDGYVRYDRSVRSFTLCTSDGLHELPFQPEKNFAGFYAAVAQSLSTGADNPMLPTAEDGMIATRIARTATDQVIAGRLQ